MMYGNTGRILDIDLTSGKVEEINLPEEVYRQYIGGSGLAAKIFLDRKGWQVDPLATEAPLIFMSGPLTGIKLNGSSRSHVAGRSPLTGIWGDAACGGNFGAWCKYAGFDGMIVTGAASDPVYLLVTDAGIDIRDADYLWGKDTYEVTDILKEAHSNPGVRVVTIGIAGENGVRFASIQNDKGHTFGRCGFGAVMGSKSLKAIAVGTSGREVSVAKPEQFTELRKGLSQMVKENVMLQMTGEYGTDGILMDACISTGDVPTMNWQREPDKERGPQLGGIPLAETYLVRRDACWGCAVACKRVCAIPNGAYATPEGPGPEYETVAAFGNLLCNYDLASIVRMNDLCNRYGIDSISCGATIAWAIECFEKGILTLEDTGGLALGWGGAPAILELLDRIAHRRGLGDLLAEGSQRASQKLGADAEECLTCVKGMEAPMHDPRVGYGLGLAYATSTRGACHMSTSTENIEFGAVFCPEIGLDKAYVLSSNEDKAQVVAIASDLGAVANSAGLCNFLSANYPVADLVALFNTVADYEWDSAKMMEAGQRVWYLKRCLGHLMGMKAEDDRLPKRIAVPLDAGPSQGQAPDMEQLLRDFYQLRGLDSRTGKPDKDRLERLGLAEVAALL